MKKIDLKSIIIGIVSGILLVSGISIASTLVTGDVYFSSFPIYVNGNYYATSSPLLNYNGRTYVPLNELGTMLGTNVTFNNGVIYLANSNNIYNNNYYDNYYGSTKTYEEDINIEVDESEEYYVSLARFGAKSAKITATGSSVVKLSTTQLLSSGDLRITGKKEGKSTVKITYSTGDVEILYVNVYADEDNEEDIEMSVGDTHKIYIDLDDYDADSAKVTYDSDYIKVSKTSFTNDGYLTITAKKEGDTTVKIKYDSGDVDYYYIEIEDDDYNYDDIEVEEDEYEYLYVDLEEYDATSAELTYNSSYIKLSKTKLTESGKVKVTGKKEGLTSIKIKFNTGDIVYVEVEVIK